MAVFKEVSNLLMVSNVLQIIFGGSVLFYPAINVDQRSLRLRTSEFGKSLKGKVIVDDRYALADYRLYVYQNIDDLKQLETNIIDAANMLYDIGIGLTDGAVSRYRPRDNAWRWRKHRQDEQPTTYSGLQDYLLSSLVKKDMNLLDRLQDTYQNNDGINIQREILYPYMDWAENSYLPTNWIGGLRVSMKSIPVFFKDQWYGRESLSWNDPRHQIYDFLMNTFDNARLFYKWTKHLVKLKQYDEVIINRINAKVSEYYDAINLIRTLRRLYDEPYTNHDKPTAQEIDEMLFEMGMDDALPHWDPEICQRCDGQGQLTGRRCVTCMGYGYHNPLRLYPVLYPGSYGSGKLQKLNLESRNPFLSFGRSIDTISSGRWGNTLRELPFPDDIDQLLDKAESINSRDD